MGWADGRHALITGGGSGIGAAAAKALAAQGARVSLLGRARDRLEAVAQDTGGRAIACDITDRGSQEQAFAEARDAFGPLDMVILNGMSRYHLAAEALRRAAATRPETATLVTRCESLIAQAVAYSREHLEDVPAITNWSWTAG